MDWKIKKVGKVEFTEVYNNYMHLKISLIADTVAGAEAIQRILNEHCKDVKVSIGGRK